MPVMPVVKQTLLIFMVGCALVQAEISCPESSRRLYYHAESSVNLQINPGFSDTLFTRLQAPLNGLGYCFTNVARNPNDTNSQDLWLLIRSRSSGENIALTAAVLTEGQRRAGKVAQALAHPLTELETPRGEAALLNSVFPQKIIENLRTQYVAQVAMVTQPEGAKIQASNGLEGITPLEWVLPLGNLHVVVSHPGYLTREIDLDLSRPGEHTFSLPLISRRFYHSRFFPLAALAATTSLGAYMAQNYYYNQYHRLGLSDQQNRPEQFGEIFGKAKTWERISAGTLGLALISLGLTFRF